MSQHFLLSSAARTLSLMALCQLSDEAAYEMFRRLRWPDSDGAPVCPECDCPVVYMYRCRRLFKCKRCHWQFSVRACKFVGFVPGPVGYRLTGRG